MHLGLIGGIGAAATVLYYRGIVAGVRARGVPLRMTLVQADLDTLIANAEAGRAGAQARIYAGHIDALKAAGAEVAAITSLGGHFCFAETQAISALPLASAVAPVARHCADNGIARLGLLGTRYVMESALYGQLGAVEALAPEDAGAVHDAYQALALANACTPAQAAFFHAEGRKLVARGADAVLLAGTDLCLAFDGTDPGYPVVDAARIHVAALVELALA